MYLRELQMVGFKSFAQSVRIELGPGITAVVGPNGSGKSNIVDAVRWVLGEQSARALRGARSEDVIFGGSAMRRPMGMAEVTLVLDNTEKRVAVDAAEIAIARLLYRSGDTEYLLNRRRARLRDVLDVAGQAGLGPDSYCVVGQGAIEQLVLQRPHERRALIADAADIRRYEARLAEIESDLSQTQANALRASAVVAEIRPQLDRLHAQAERAERHRRVRDELERVAMAWYGRAIPGARRAIELAESRRTALQAAIAEARVAAAASERKRAGLHQQATVLKGDLRSIRDQLRQARDAREALRVEQAALEERRQALSRRLEEWTAQAQRETERIEAAELALRGSTAARDEAAAELERLGPAEEDGARRADAHLAESRRAQVDAQGRLDAARADVAKLDREYTELQSAADAAATAAAVSEARRVESQTRMRELTTSVAAAEHDLEAATARLEAVEGQVAEARRRHDRATEDLRLATARLGEKSQSLDRLLGEERALAALFPSEQAAGLEGRLIARLPAPARYARAVAAALGETALFRVVEGDTAWFIDVADDDASHSSGLAPDQGAPERSRGVDSSAAPDEFRAWVAAALAGKVTFALAVDLLGPRADAGLVRRYLGTTIVVENLNDARVAAEALKARGDRAKSVFSFRVATESGECLWSTGERVLRPVGTGPLDALARRSDLTAQIQTARAASAVAEEQHAEAGEAEEAARGTLASVEADRQLALADARQHAAHARSLSVSLGLEQQRLGRLAEPRGEQPPLPLHADLPRRRAAALARVEEAYVQVRRWAEDVARAEEEGRIARDQHAGAASQRAVALERLARRQEAMERDARELGRLQEEAKASEADRAQAAADAARIASDAVAVEGRLADTTAQVARLEAVVADIELQLAENEAALEAADDEQRQTQARLADLREAEATAGAQANGARGTLERLQAEVAAVAEALGMEPAAFTRAAEAHCSSPATAPSVQKNEAPQPMAPTALDDEELQRRLARAQRELRGVGAVDYGVLADYSVLKDRCDYLTGQIDDLTRAEAAIREGMAEVREQMQAHFMSAFGDVNQRFGEVFRELFQGGDAELVLAGDPDTPQGGIDIIAQPPGKRLHRLATLSGGERALVGAALLLALIGANPSPFCMLDEVDAALDEANVQRFVGTIRELARDTQFILVTHNRATMEAADALYGVTMTPGAVSQVVAMRLAEALPAALGR